MTCLPQRRATPTMIFCPAPDDKDARRAYARQLRSRSAALTLWWLDRMVRVRHPLVERLTFTWHGDTRTSDEIAAERARAA